MKKRVLALLICIVSVLSAETKIDDIQLKKMIGEMLIVGFNEHKIDENSPIVKQIKEHNIGGVILFDRFYTQRDKVKNIASPAQLKELTSKLQSYANNDLIIAIDQEGGRVQRLKKRDGFIDTPSAKEVSKMNMKEAKRVYDALAMMLQENGINTNFAPVVDLNVNKENPVIEGLQRSYGSSPEVVTKYAKIFIDSQNSRDIISVLKHFPGHGSSKDDSHKGFVDITGTWSKKELEPYKELIKLNDAKMIMSAHVFNSHLDKEYPATLSYNINTKLLREELGFKGVIVSDDLQMSAIAQHYSLSECVTLAINAGIDMLLFGNQLSYNDTKEIIETVFQQVKNGSIKMENIILSNQRVSKLKKLYFAGRESMLYTPVPTIKSVTPSTK